MAKDRKRIHNTIIFTALLAALFATWVIWGHIRYNNFKKHEIHSIIVKSDDWWGKMIQFIFADESSFYAMQPVNDKIQVGDSVSKKANSAILKIYRKNATGVSGFHIYYDADENNYYTLSGTKKVTSP
jgi:hypothetical protein